MVQISICITGNITLNGQIVVGAVLYRTWKAQVALNSNTLPLEEWIKEEVSRRPLNTSSVEEMDLRLLSRKPSQRATRYLRMKAYGNHFRVDDPTTAQLQTYDSGVASIFHVPTEDAREVSINYVGVLKDILKLDYGPLHTHVNLMKCEWMKRADNRGNNTSARDEASFLLINFRHKLPRMANPFIFPTQATQVFFFDDQKKPGWKVVLRKEARSKGEVVNTADVFITTTSEASSLTVPTEVPAHLTTQSLVGAIELLAEDNLLAIATY
jgi:hypothetical protein